MRRLWDALIGLLLLLPTLARTGFRTSGRYWAWRNETAFGKQGKPSSGGLDAIIGYLAWVRRMRRLG